MLWSVVQSALSVIVFDLVLVANEHCAFVAVEAAAVRHTAAKRIKSARFIGAGSFLGWGWIRPMSDAASREARNSLRGRGVYSPRAAVSSKHKVTVLKPRAFPMVPMFRRVEVR